MQYPSHAYRLQTKYKYIIVSNTTTGISKMILTITDWVPGTLNPDRRICGFSILPEKTNFGDFRKFHAFPEISLRFLTFPEVSLSFPESHSHFLKVIMLPECHSHMRGVLVFAIRRIPLFISLNRAMDRRCPLVLYI